MPTIISAHRTTWASPRRSSTDEEPPPRRLHMNDETDVAPQEQDARTYLDQEIQEATYRTNLQLANLARASSLRNRTAATMACQLLQTMPHPDTVAYNSVLGALARSSSYQNKPAAQMAQRLLQEMEDINKEQTAAREAWYARLDSDDLSPVELSAGPPRVRVKPNVRTYSTVMDIWGKQSNPEAALQAMNLLETLLKKFQDAGDVALQPNVITYNSCLNAWAKAGANVEGARQCETLLKRMMGNREDDCWPDVISFNICLQAWARSGSPAAGERAEAILREEMPKAQVQPNARTYSAVMDAWSRSFSSVEDSARRAHVLLLELEKLAAKQTELLGVDDRKRNSLKPNFVSYATVINAYALSRNEPLKAHKAFGLLQRMVKLSKRDHQLRPNHVTYNSVLNACATSNPITVKEFLAQRQEETGKDMAHFPELAEMVRTLYTQLLQEKHLQPDHYTFGTVLKAVDNLFWGEPDQVEFARQVFHEACERGQVSFGVLSQLRQAVPSEVYRELLPSKATSGALPDALMNFIPISWTRNVREKTRRRQSYREE